MHIPDGFLDARVTAITDFVSWSFFLYTARQFSREKDIEKIPLLGLLTAYTFAVNVFSFPAPGGTSAHLTGSMVAFSIAGITYGYFVICLSLILQAVLFQHGGILSSGANFLNIGIASMLVYLGVVPFKKNKNLYFVLCAVGALLSIELGAFFCSAELSLSGVSNFKSTLPLMLAANFIPAIVDAVATYAILRAYDRFKFYH